MILSTAVDPPVMGKLDDLTYNSIHKLFLKFSCYYIAPFKFFDDENHFQFLTVFDDFTLIFIFFGFFLHFSLFIFLKFGDKVLTSRNENPDKWLKKKKGIHKFLQKKNCSKIYNSKLF